MVIPEASNQRCSYGIQGWSKNQMSSPTFPSPAEVTMCSSHICCPTSVAHHQGVGVPSLRVLVQHHPAWIQEQIPRVLGGKSGSCVSQQVVVKLLTTIFPGGPAIWEGTGRSCLAQEKPTGDGVLPHGSPRRWRILVPHSVLRLPLCQAAQGCHILK